MTHTTSASYQIVASLDAWRRQMELEGYELVEQSIEMAMVLRLVIKDHPKLSKFSLIDRRRFDSSRFRVSDEKNYYDIERGWDRMEASWELDDFVLDPTKLTLSVGKTGITGDAFKNQYLMDRFGIQVNKTQEVSLVDDQYWYDTRQCYLFDQCFVADCQ